MTLTISRIISKLILILSFLSAIFCEISCCNFCTNVRRVELFVWITFIGLQTWIILLGYLSLNFFLVSLMFLLLNPTSFILLSCVEFHERNLWYLLTTGWGLQAMLILFRVDCQLGRCITIVCITKCNFCHSANRVDSLSHKACITWRLSSVLILLPGENP